MKEYQLEYIKSIKGDIIHLRFVESLGYKHALTNDEEYRSIEKLSGKTIFLLKTISGSTHEICLEEILEKTNDRIGSTHEMAVAICQKWIKVNSKED